MSMSLADAFAAEVSAEADEDAMEECVSGSGAEQAVAGTEQAVASASVVPERCLLCDLALHPDHGELCGVIGGFIADHITRTQVAKIASDVLAVLKENLPAELVANTTIADVIRHIQTHTTNSTVIMTQVVRDLVELASVARESCVITCEETRRKMMNPKAAAVYLKTVGELQTALRHEALRVQK